MPKYQFVCGKCQNEFTVEASFAEYDRKEKFVCPKCGSKEIAQKIGGNVFLTGLGGGGCSGNCGCGCGGCGAKGE